MSNGDFTELLAREEVKEKLMLRNSQVSVFCFLVFLAAAYLSNFFPNANLVGERVVYETFLEPRTDRNTRLYWKNFFEHSKSGTVNARASHYSNILLKQNISASADSLLAKIEQGPFWARKDYLVNEIGMTKSDASIVAEELKRAKKTAASSSKRREAGASATKPASGQPAKGDSSKDIIRSWEGTDYYALPNTAIVDDQTYFPLYFALFCVCYVGIMVAALFYCFRKTTKEQLEQRKRQQAIATALADAAALR
jgi:hypothetical protein